MRQETLFRVMSAIVGGVIAYVARRLWIERPYDFYSLAQFFGRYADRRRKVALYIAGNLDDNGYLTRDVNSMVYDIEEQTGQVASTAEVRSMLVR